MKHLQKVQEALSLLMRLWVGSPGREGTSGIGEFGHVALVNVTEPCSGVAARAPRFLLAFPGCELPGVPRL